MATYFEKNQEHILRDLFDWLKIPTISADPKYRKEISRGVKWLASHLKKVGLENIQVLKTSSENSPPIVYADWLHAGKNKPTVLIYGHYDVQPPDPLNEWKSKPFEPVIRDGKIFARGADDNKGQHFALIKSVEAILNEDKKLLPNIKMFFEGEEEIGGTHLEQWIKNNKNRLKADVCLISDTPMLSAKQPSIITGLRGIVYIEINVKTAKTDMHSGHYGGNVLNPNQVLADVLSKLKDRNGKILIPGFYDDVRNWTKEERKKINEVKMTEEEIKEHTGAKVVFGEPDFTPIERFSIRPTLDINGMWGGFSGEGPKTVIPNNAGAKISMRMVADQDPDKIEKSFKKYVKSLLPEGVDCKFKTFAKDKAVVVDPSSKFFQSATESLREVFGKEPKYVMEGGSIPVGGHIKKYLGLDTIYMGFGLPDDNLHAPNEKFDVKMLNLGIEAAKLFLTKLAK